MAELFEQFYIRSLKAQAEILKNNLASGGWQSLSEAKQLVGQIQGLDRAMSIFEDCVKERSRTKDND